MYKVDDVVEQDVLASPEVRDEETGDVIFEARYEKRFVQIQRDATDAEIAEIEARKEAANDPVQASVQFIKQVDTDVDAIYAAAIGNRGPEYDQAAADASAYKASGYAGAVPASVQSWANAKSWTPQQAADDILVAAARLATARDAIRANRLQCKESARTAGTIDAVNAVKQQWSTFVVYIRQALGI